MNMMKIINACVVIALLALMMTGGAESNSDDECYYDPKAINYDYFLKHTRFSSAKWDDTKKEARIDLENKSETVIVQYSACHQFGITAQYRMKRSKEKLNRLFLVNKLKWLGEKILKSDDYKLLIQSLNNSKFLNDLDEIGIKERVFVGVEGSDYQSFLVFVVNYRDDFFVEISWYM